MAATMRTPADDGIAGAREDARRGERIKIEAARLVAALLDDTTTWAHDDVEYVEDDFEGSVELALSTADRLQREVASQLREVLGR